MHSLIETQTQNRIFYITLNRPEKRNAFNFELVGAIKSALSEAFIREDVRIIVIRANGAAFSAGADLDYLQTMQKNTLDENLKDSDHLKELFQMIYLAPKIVIAQIEGHAIAGGCGLATVCDFSFAVPEAMFGYTEVKIGFIPAIVSFFLVRKIGEGKARELLLTGKLISAQEAKDHHIINFIADKNSISEEVEKFALQLANETSGESIQMTKSLMASIPTLDTKVALNMAVEANAKARSTKDCIRGIGAFLNKEKITW